MSDLIYRQFGLPVFQNKVYPTAESARLAATGDVELVQCADTGLVHNGMFDASLLRYDGEYQNEQAFSPAFRHHLENVLKVLLARIGEQDFGIEIGCGKGYFLEMLSNAHANVMGYDPAYEGSNPRIIKQYFGESDVEQCPDYVILRHVLEHIPSPWPFLAQLATKCKPGTVVYIEVPCFDWIVENTAFYDVFYEHVNYFTLDVLRRAFGVVIDSGKFFGGQYLYIIADISSFREPTKYTGRVYGHLPMDAYLETLMGKADIRRDLFVWGAGAKGITFANVIARAGHRVSAIVDINPAKQGRFIGLSGIPIVSPSKALPRLDGTNLFVMNPVYLDEIKSMTGTRKINWISVA